MEEKKDILPLLFATIDNAYIVDDVKGKQDDRKRYMELGFVSGAEVSVINKSSNGLMVNVKQTRFALGATAASKIYVYEKQMEAGGEMGADEMNASEMNANETELGKVQDVRIDGSCTRGFQRENDIEIEIERDM